MAATYRAHPTIHEMKHQTAGHCDYFAKEVLKAAQGARQMAADHAEMAKEVK